MKIEIGRETWEYEIEGDYTHISDDEGEVRVTLRWAASEGEIRAAAYGFGAGMRLGIAAGEAKKLAEIQRVLQIGYARE
jgi:hypothetical protein